MTHPTTHGPHGWIAPGLWMIAAAGLVALILVGPVHAAGLPLPVPRITLYPGDSIRSDHLVDQVFNARTRWRSAVYRSREDVIGKIARRTLLPGRPIPVNAVREPYLVVQSRTVQIVFREGPLTITSYAVALQSGGNGDVVRVRNVDSGAIIKGTIEPDGTVRVGAP